MVSKKFDFDIRYNIQMSFIYNRNNVGRITDTCCTPQVTSSVVETKSLTAVVHSTVLER